jgi:hypothetical protein
VLRDIEAGYIRGAGSRGQKTRQDTHRCSFPGSVRTKKTNDLPFLNFEGNIVDSDSASVSLRKAFHLDHNETLLNFEMRVRIRRLTTSTTVCAKANSGRGSKNHFA